LTRFYQKSEGISLSLDPFPACMAARQWWMRIWRQKRNFPAVPLSSFEFLPVIR
jgi:hypothetical protein